MGAGHQVLGLVGAGRIGQMHAGTLAGLDGVELRVTDVDADRGRAVAQAVGAAWVPDVDALMASGLDGLVVAAPTATHPGLIRAGIDAGLPVFCEKPVALALTEALALMDEVTATGGVVQVGHQRRLDPGYREARRAVAAGELGRIHSVRALTCDVTPPPVEFLATSGGLFRDCSVHDFDAVRWVTGREIVQVYATGSNNGDPAIGQAGDIDAGLVVATLDDGTIATVSASRYNGAGHDVRLELQGELDTLVVGLDDHSAVRSAEPGAAFPAGPPHPTFAERFTAAYRGEIVAFLELVAGRGDNPCPIRDAVAAAVVAEAAQESLLAGRPVDVTPVPS